MFKFNFSDVQLEEEFEEGSEISEPKITGSQILPELPNAIYQGSDASDAGAHYRELSIEELTKDLPPALSYSPIVIPVGEGENRVTVTLLRRDLFDARFQLIAQDDVQDGPEIVQESHSAATRSLEGTGDDKSDIEALAFIDNPSDLVPGVYEGGLKTWECSLDLVETLHNLSSGPKLPRDLKGKRVLEIGCGTAIPSLYLLNELFNQNFEQSPQHDHEHIVSEIILQDYNDLVLRLVTFPNVLLTWYTSALAIAYREKRAESEDEDETFNPTEAGEIAVTPELVSNFIASLNEKQIRVRFVAGSWDGMLHSNLNQSKTTSQSDLFAKPFDIVLTSETIYRLSSLPTLMNLLRLASRGRDCDDISDHDYSTLENRTSRLAINPRRTSGMLCLVAAKVLYFGVGGGIVDFERLMKDNDGQLTTVLEKTTGVGRRVLEASWG